MPYEVIHHASRDIYINNDTIITSWDITGGNILHKVVFWGYVAHNTRQTRPWEVGILQQPVPANCHGFLFVFSGVVGASSRHFPRLCQTTITKLFSSWLYICILFWSSFKWVRSRLWKANCYSLFVREKPDFRKRPCSQLPVHWGGLASWFSVRQASKNKFNRNSLLLSLTKLWVNATKI